MCSYSFRQALIFQERSTSSSLRPLLWSMMYMTTTTENPGTSHSEFYVVAVLSIERHDKHRFGKRSTRRIGILSRIIGHGHHFSATWIVSAALHGKSTKMGTPSDERCFSCSWRPFSLSLKFVPLHCMANATKMETPVGCAMGQVSELINRRPLHWRTLFLNSSPPSVWPLHGSLCDNDCQTSKSACLFWYGGSWIFLSTIVLFTTRQLSPFVSKPK